KDVEEMIRVLEATNVEGDMFLSATHQKVLKSLRYADYLSPKYHVVIANPPYMEISGANGRLKSWALDNYPDSSSNLFAMFMERGLILSKALGMLSMINMQAWMFLSSFSRLREKAVKTYTILSMAHLGENAFDSIGGDVVSTTAFIIQNRKSPHHKGEFIRLVSGTSESEKAEMFRAAIVTKDKRFYFRSEPTDFEKIPGSPISYWASNQLRIIFKENPTLKSVASPRKGMVTADNPRFIRVWYEVSYGKLGIDLVSRSAAKSSGRKWFPYLKGGPFKRWYGNVEHVVNWERDGFELLNMKGNGYKVGSTNHNLDFIFKPAITWTKITTGLVSFRSTKHGFLFDDASGLCYVTDLNMQPKIAGLLNSPVVYAALGALNPTLNVNPGNLADIPVVLATGSSEVAIKCIDLSKDDWDSFETSWNFNSLPLLYLDDPLQTLQANYQKIRAHWWKMTLEMQQLEKENNRIFIEAYSLQDDMRSDVPLSEITLNCNPYYRYGNNKSETQLESMLLVDTMRNFLSYAVGCMMGRYSLDKEGLILANAGDTVENYLQKVGVPQDTLKFKPDSDGIIPVLDGEWFEDDIVARTREFLIATFGAATLEENIRFIEDALGKDLRKYFTTDFYKDHLKTYKKRPIYWMFQSPKKGFSALVYLHRYTRDTANTLLNGYLREFLTKLRSRIAHYDHLLASESTSAREKSKMLKESDQYKKTLRECEEYERSTLLPLAQARIELDLDDGVKVNYQKLGDALATIPGLANKEDE
ncbi:MAG: BREX-1 system adenine-specific DNA-methyltransferase PglX, partial [Fibrobacteres bacterium]|nr:BREX-1 system adenine-specific DNA-methyltransferase PglX [Fibrobacterota bacterium]